MGAQLFLFHTAVTFLRIREDPPAHLTPHFHAVRSLTFTLTHTFITFIYCQGISNTMAFEVSDPISAHPTNNVKETKYPSASNKAWAEEYPVITKLNVYSKDGKDGSFTAKFDGPFLPLLADDYLRMAERAYPPNDRTWRIDTEADVTNWFHHEVSSVVLAAWKTYPTLLQTAESSAPREDYISQRVDLLYSIYVDQMMRSVVVGEMKRSLIKPKEWLRGDLAGSESQKRLSQELRGLSSTSLLFTSNMY